MDQGMKAAFASECIILGVELFMVNNHPRLFVCLCWFGFLVLVLGLLFSFELRSLWVLVTRFDAKAFLCFDCRVAAFFPDLLMSFSNQPKDVSINVVRVDS